MCIVLIACEALKIFICIVQFIQRYNEEIRKVEVIMAIISIRLASSHERAC